MQDGDGTARSICMQTNACVLQKKAGLSNEQVEALITLRENYMGRTRRILQHRQSLWQTVRANLLDSSLLDGSPSAERKICSFEKMLELRRNMDDFHWNFAWMMREWLMRHLSPLQVNPPAQPRVYQRSHAPTSVMHCIAKGGCLPHGLIHKLQKRWWIEV